MVTVIIFLMWTQYVVAMNLKKKKELEIFEINYSIGRDHVYALRIAWFSTESLTLSSLPGRTKGLTPSIEPDKCLRSMFRMEAAIPFTTPVDCCLFTHTCFELQHRCSLWHYYFTTKSQGVVMDPVPNY